MVGFCFVLFLRGWGSNLVNDEHTPSHTPSESYRCRRRREDTDLTRGDGEILSELDFNRLELAYRK